MRKRFLLFGSLSIFLILGLSDIRLNNKTLAQTMENTNDAAYEKPKQTTAVPENVSYELLFRLVNKLEQKPPNKKS